MLKERNRILEQKLQHIIRHFYGTKSEKLDPAQLELLFNENLGKPEASPSALALAEAATKNNPEAHKPTKQRGSHRSRIKGLDTLPVETQEIIPDIVAADPNAYERIGEEISEQLDYIPAKAIRRVTIRPKFRHKIQRHLPPIVAPAPLTPLLGGLPSAALLAHILVGKYIDHLPIYRQQHILQRAGVSIPRDLIIHWIHKSITLIKPIAEAIKRETLASPYIQVDETTTHYLNPGQGKAPLGYLWVVNVPGGSLYYHWGIGRGVEQLIQTIGKNYSGTLQSDAYTVYSSYENQQPDNQFTHMACLAHIRRNFVEVIEAGPQTIAAYILKQIGHLYRIEARLRQIKAGPALREAVRASESANIYQRIGRIMQKMLHRYRPQQSMSQALMYGISNWKRMGVYLSDGRIEIDNNLVENAVRPIKLGQKNWLFFGSKEAGHTAAAVYTIVENCRRYGIAVESYLEQLLEKMPGVTDEKEIESLTPARIAEIRRRKKRSA